MREERAADAARACRLLHLRVLGGARRVREEGKSEAMRARASRPSHERASSALQHV